MNEQHNSGDETSIAINIFGKIAKLFIGQFQLTILVILLIVSVGIVGLNSLPKESLPEIIFPAITIQTIFPGASPEDVEALVTEKIENKVKDFDDIDSVDSETGFGISVVTVTFLESVDIEKKKIELDNALREISFSDGVNDPEAFIFSTSEIPLMNISVAGDYELTELTAIATAIKEEVESIRGVDSVEIDGEVSPEIEIALNELKMMKYRLTFNQIRQAIQNNNFNAPIGELSLNGVRYNLRVEEEYDTIEDIENTFIQEGVYIKDVATVFEELEPIDSYNRTFIQGENEKALPSLFLTVSRKVNSDVIGTSEAIKELLTASKGTLYPEDVTIYVSNDLAVNVENDLDKIQNSAWSGLLVVIVVLFLFIGLRESIIVSITIPLSLLGTLGLLNLFGITFNTFAILGLIVALGLLVDNSIIVMENIDRLHKKGMSVMDAAFYGTNQVGFPVTAATLTTLFAFFPLAILPGILGAFVSTIPITIMITISVSLVVSLVITPSLASKIITDKEKHRIPRTIRVIGATGIVAGLSYTAFSDIANQTLMWIMVGTFSVLMFLRMMFVSDKGLEATPLTEVYSRMIQWIVTKKRRAIVVLIIGFTVLGASFTTLATGVLKISFFPVNEPTSLTIDVDTVGGMTLDSTDNIVQEIEKKLYTVDTITQFNSTIGGNEIDSAQISVELDVDEVSGFESKNRIEQLLEKIPGAQINIQGIAAGPPVGKPLELRIVGEDLYSTNAFAGQVYDDLMDIEGVYNIESSATVGVPQLILNINRGKALEYGITPLQMTNHLRGELNGVKAATLRREDQEIDIVLRRDLEDIDTIETVENLFIPGPQNNMLILSNLATLDEMSGISGITRKDGERIITITGDLREGYNINDVVLEIQQDYPSERIPTGIELRYSGDVENIEENFGNLFQSMILAVFLVFIILTLQFRSIGQPFIILATLPMAFIGVIWGLVITDNEFGFYAFMGLIALVGIAVNDAIVLIDYINYLRQQGKTVPLAIKEAGKTRFNPVLATTLTTISGVLPLAFKEAYYAQFSFALIFGLMVTTLLTLIYVPTIYGLFIRKEAKV